ncbi:hypothetical protein DSO57_1031488 [Entomophthora muscae]|uniref:Uncharacterized protein n=1 Tax=Entomophthora muscae TaxID=34485 RepID=A0ACC2T0N9_9FUNG|nr:hypothetical protein DSO57_1031488 [Entomophthora muscae]
MDNLAKKINENMIMFQNSVSSLQELVSALEEENKELRLQAAKHRKLLDVVDRFVWDIEKVHNPEQGHEFVKRTREEGVISDTSPFSSENTPDMKRFSSHQSSSLSSRFLRRRKAKGELTEEHQEVEVTICSSQESDKDACWHSSDSSEYIHF